MSNEVTVAQTTGMMASPVEQKQNALTTVASAREMAEAQGMIMMAKSFPRDVVQARDDILNACTRPKLAEQAVYAYARGGSEITGPSIRLAEMIAQNWGNIQYGVRELEQRNGESTCEAYAWDMQKNTRQSKVFQVPHIRHTRRGDTLLTDPRDIYELVANNGARRVRACILGVIPGDIVDEAVKQCELTMRTKIDLSPDRIKGLIEAFEKIGVKRSQLEKRIQRNIETILPAQFSSLGKIYNSIHDGMSKPNDWFEEEVAESAPADGASKKSIEVLAEAVGIAVKETKKAVSESKK